MKRTFKILGSFVISTFLLANGTKAFASDYDRIDIKKIYGKDRFSTATEVSQEGWYYSDYAIVANGLGFADALCSTPLSKAVDGPILLTHANKLPDTTKNEIRRLGVKKVYIVGGTGAVSKNVENQIRSMGIQVQRLGGKDRFETSLLIAKEMEKLVYVDDIVIVPGDEKFEGADALSIAPIAGSRNMPMLLASKNEISPSIKKWISGMNANNTYVVGQTGAISDKAIKDIPSVIKINGKDRFDTNLKVLDEFSYYLEYERVYTSKAVDSSIVDALTTGPLAAKKSSPLLLVGDKLTPAQNKYLSALASRELIAIGGETPNDVILGLGKLLDKNAASKIKSVTINEPREIIIEFDGIVKKSKAESKYNYEIPGVRISRVELMDGYSIVKLTLRDDLTKSKISNLEGTVENILGDNMKVRFSKKNSSYDDKVTDNVKPTITGVEVSDISGTSLKRIKIKFSEKVKKADATNLNNYSIKDSKGVNVKLTSASFDNKDENEATIVTESVINSNGSYKLEVKGIRDLSNNIMNPYGKSISLKDTTKPKVASFKITDTSNPNIKYINITFSKDLNEASAIAKGNYIIKDEKGKSYANSISKIEFDKYYKDRVTVTINNVSMDGECTIEVKNIKDLSGNAMEPYKSSLSLSLARPSVILPFQIDFVDKNFSNKRIIKVRFDRDMNKTDVSRTSSYVIRQGSITVPVKKAEYSNSGGQYVATLTTEDFIEEGEYSLQFQGIKDATGVPLNSQPVDIYISNLIRPNIYYANTKISDIYVKDTNKKDVLTNRKTIEIKFDKSMKASTINNMKANFVIQKDGSGEKVLVKDVKYTDNSNQYIATITTEDFKFNGDYSIIINNVTDSSGVKIKKDTTDRFKVSNIKPQIKEISKGAGENQLDISFNEMTLDEKSAQDISNYSLLIGKEKIALDELSVDSNKVTLTLTKELETGCVYELEVSGVSEVEKNIMNTEKYTFEYDGKKLINIKLIFKDGTAVTK
ncbi:cell wall-binding repeat-containing protein [Clostridium sp. UBA6640]|uniref:cell wall-binding repeat-containing protein n=1 Tax=Clostridium sp. UBA6640 TaxID=1946370 RepID=UPI0025BCED81|nr:cell wall-binding repeat-containing protein [Clostridium sp. UBA6640]